MKSSSAKPPPPVINRHLYKPHPPDGIIYELLLTSVDFEIAFVVDLSVCKLLRNGQCMMEPRNKIIGLA